MIDIITTQQPLLTPPSPVLSLPPTIMPPPHLLLISVLLFLCAFSAAQQHPDLLPLLVFKSSLTSSAVLSNWTTSSATPCSWPHVTCLHGRVSHLLLHNLRLSSSSSPLFPLLSSLTKLRLLSLHNNSFSGPILIPSNLTVTFPLRLLFLSRNYFSGPLPLQLLPLLPRLLRLDLSHNLLSGPLPLSFPPSLLTLRLELNNFSGSVPSLSLSSLRDFNVSANALSGPIPRQLSAFPASAFSGNSGLCGAPLSACARFSSYPTRPGSEIAPPMSKPESVITSSPSSMPTSVAAPANPHRSAAERTKPFALIAIIVGDFLVLVVISLILYCYLWRSYAEKMREGSKKSMSKVLAGDSIVYSTSPYPVNPPGSSGCDRGKMVFFDAEVRRFELEDLLKASAEMLGKGGMGTAYKAVLEDGSVVAVKRLRDVGNGGMGRKEVEQRMEVLGGLRHGNVVGFRAYYFSREEKLLVYDYMPDGSLFWLLHGNRGVGRTPMDWTTRLKIAAEAASGITFIHNSCKSLKLIHGNIKSTNILINRSGDACVTDYGLTAFLSSSPPPRPNGYRAPEAATDNRKLTQKSDVYSFGVVLLELLTGKFPSAADNGNVVEYGGSAGGVLDLPRWVQSVVREEWTAELFDLELMRYKDIEEGMVGLLHVALACTCAAPEQRPKMGQVVHMIEEIHRFDVSRSHQSLDSPSQSEGTSQ